MYAGRSQDAADRQRWIFPKMPLTDREKKTNKMYKEENNEAKKF
jgi:hypothetical protein